MAYNCRWWWYTGPVSGDIRALGVGAEEAGRKAHSSILKQVYQEACENPVDKINGSNDPYETLKLQYFSDIIRQPCDSIEGSLEGRE